MPAIFHRIPRLGDFNLAGLFRLALMQTTSEAIGMDIAVIKPRDHRAVQDAYWEQIEFGNAPNTAKNLAMIVFLQRYPTVPIRNAQACVEKILQGQL